MRNPLWPESLFFWDDKGSPMQLKSRRTSRLHSEVVVTLECVGDWRALGSEGLRPSFLYWHLAGQQSIESPSLPLIQLAFVEVDPADIRVRQTRPDLGYH